jgi:hypothetical protein
MRLIEHLAADLASVGLQRLSLPEHRQIELYTKRKALSFQDPEAASDVPIDRVAHLARTALVFDAVLGGHSPGAPGASSWQRILDLPRVTAGDKRLAELARVLRVARTIVFHPRGHVEMRDGIVRLNGAIDRVALSLEITVAGIDLVNSMMAYWFGALGGPYPEAYVDAMLAEYFFDVVAEIKRFADEDRILHQFRRTKPFCRHFRFDCDNPKAHFVDGFVEIEIGALHRDPARFPIDFFAVLDEALHIVPVEALTDGRIAVADLPKWRARTPDALSLPATFRPRFAREPIVVGQPMT